MVGRLKSLLLFAFVFGLGIIIFQGYFHSLFSVRNYGTHIQKKFLNNSRLQSNVHGIKQRPNETKTKGDYLAFNQVKTYRETTVYQRDTGWLKTIEDKPDTRAKFSDVSVQADHELRIKNLKQTCKESQMIRQKEQRKANLSDFFYSRHYRFAYCKVPKSGSTFWMKVFMVLGKGENYTKQISRMSRTEIHAHSRMMMGQPARIMHSNIHTIVVSRNPFSRLYSAYVDKVYMPLFWDYFLTMEHVVILPPYHLNDTIEVLKSSHVPLQGRFIKYRDSLLEKGLLIEKNISKVITPVCANNASFEDFLRFIISEIKVGHALEPHWAPISHLCHPCKFNTYKIVKQETFAPDVEHALKSVGVDLNHYEWLKQSLRKNRSSASVPSIVAVVENKLKRRAVSNCIDQETVIERLWKSFQIQGFISDEIQCPRSPVLNMTKFSKNKVTKAVLEAISKKTLTELEKAQQRYKYLKTAYANVSSQTIAAIQDIYYLDFILFGYPIHPPT